MQWGEPRNSFFSTCKYLLACFLPCLFTLLSLWHLFTYTCSQISFYKNCNIYFWLFEKFVFISLKPREVNLRIKIATWPPDFTFTIKETALRSKKSRSMKYSAVVLESQWRFLPQNTSFTSPFVATLLIGKREKSLRAGKTKRTKTSLQKMSISWVTLGSKLTEMKND